MTLALLKFCWAREVEGANQVEQAPSKFQLARFFEWNEYGRFTVRLIPKGSITFWITKILMGKLVQNESENGPGVDAYQSVP